MPRKKPKPPIKNMGASVRSRLLNLSKQCRQPFQMVLTHYVLERLLYRLSQTEHRDRFILKGAMLLPKWFEDPLPPTKDLDFLGIGSDDQNEMVRIFKEVCGASFDDGVVFDPESVQIDGVGVRPAGVPIPDIGCEEFEKAPLRILVGRGDEGRAGGRSQTNELVHE